MIPSQTTLNAILFAALAAFAFHVRDI